MSDVIDFLEYVGQNPVLRYAPDNELDQAMTTAGIATDARTAILGQNRRDLERLLGAQANVCCMVHAPDDEDDEQEEEKPKESISGAPASPLHKGHAAAN